MQYKKTVLKNGLRIITVPMKDSQTAIGMLLVEAGSDYETKDINGLSHFLEHMCFKETTNRSGDQIKLELDGMGASSNAFTGEEYTGYYAKAHYSKIEQIIDLISDMYLNPTFPEKDINIERGVIIEEINMYEDLPQRSVYEVLEELMYGDTPAGRPIIGPKENILKFQKKDFDKYHKAHYVPEKTVLVVAGNIDSKLTVDQAKKLFGKIPKAAVINKKKTKQSQQEAQIKIKNKKTDQTHLVFAFRAFDMYDDRNYPLSVAATILGQGFSSRLFTKMRDELGMCYYTRAWVDKNTDRGVFGVSTGVSDKRALEAVEVVMSEFKKLRDEKINDDELIKAKEFMIGHVATGLETSDAWAEYFGFQELNHKKIEKPDEKIKKIKKVTAEEIQKVLKQIIKDKNLNLALIGPFESKDEEKFKKLLSI
jgi:predicted Zn-dependent peptidase